MGQPGEVCGPRRLQRPQHEQVELAPAHGPDLLLDRPAREVVTEGQRVVVQAEDVRRSARP
jgi:hypothetical protein